MSNDSDPRCGVHDGAQGHVCGAICPPCRQCAERSVLTRDRAGIVRIARVRQVATDAGIDLDSEDEMPF